MKEEKGITYKCSDCPKEVRVIYVVKENGKVKQKCQSCFYGKSDNKN